ncbi:yjeF C-terminal region, hydroxyethylthiazole kinase-related/yjeF N-terminal region [Tranquillimonas rosea]|uniref:Bifunctional NAD(P)H-hydrate repair enzyme n=1 Tax=Tranquillimonas rosea TaxID=641238 RepID=A0A1H9PVL2_9RHOB|nr:NAD(P)H-hydrate dehydratase [Tranquillimonas rosea]SER52212.1 yjeF C-terminal region, hydroxyethylthiazole kinase-related/yjeF N-terminal region [Tranquillimonas rosea]
MAELMTAARMRRIETAAMERGEVTGLDLMERAGRGAVEQIVAARPAPGHALVLCGPGNNGGDGFVVARHLHARGWSVEVVTLADPDKSGGDAGTNRDRWRAIGPIAREAGSTPPDLVVDALFGTGLSRPFACPDALRPPPGALPLRVAIDMPSGLCSDSGRIIGDGLAADLTLTFHAPKAGQYLAEGPEWCGRVVTVDIGLGMADDPGGPSLVGPPEGLGKTDGHKYAHGHALMLSGGVGRGGAARMAARAALRVGAGLVTLGCPPAAVIENAAQLNAIMLRPVADAEALSEMLSDDPRLSAVGLGPGLGTGDATRALVGAVLKARRPTVLDADALSVFADDPETLFGDLHPGCVLTPHGGEFARLFPDIAGRLAATPESGPAMSRIDAATEAAARAGCVVLLKGPDTVIAAPDGTVRVHAGRYGRAAPWLATAGTGDVLTGLIAGLLARGLAPGRAAATAAWLHVEAARRVGPGLIAEDLPEVLPAVLGGLGS